MQKVFTKFFSGQTKHGLNLQELLPVHDLESLEIPFTAEEIEGVIKDPPKDHQGKMGSIQTSLKDARISSQKTLLHFVKISIITK